MPFWIRARVLWWTPGRGDGRWQAGHKAISHARRSLYYVADIAALYLRSLFDSALSYLLFTSNPTLVKNRKIKCVPVPKSAEKVMHPVHTGTEAEFTSLASTVRSFPFFYFSFWSDDVCHQTPSGPDASRIWRSPLWSLGGYSLAETWIVDRPTVPKSHQAHLKCCN